jgi:hypothetical protein
MHYRSLKTILAATAVMCLQTQLFAAPEISVDSVHFDAGIIREGSQSSIKHVFKIKNTGNEKLVIDRVKPGCGCTAVGHDTIIPPGKEGVVTAEINLTHFKAGALRKYVTIFSNAKKSPEMSVSLGCTIRADISIEPSYIRMLRDSAGAATISLKVTSNKKDLKITEVSFKEDEKAGEKASAWQNNLPRRFSHTFAPTDVKLPDDFTEYKIDLSIKIEGEYAMYGKYIFKTNYPGKEELSYSGVIEAKQ